MLNGRSEAIVAATSVFLALSLVTVCLRCFVRARVVRAFGLDDWTMVAAMHLPFALSWVALMEWARSRITFDRARTTTVGLFWYES